MPCRCGHCIIKIHTEIIYHAIKVGTFLTPIVTGTRGNEHKLNLSHFTADSYKFNLFPRLINLWNKLPISNDSVDCYYTHFIGLVTRQCREDSTWGSISGIQDCYSIEFSTLLGSTIDLRNFYFGDVDYDVYDQTQSHTLLDSLSVSKELRSLTNSSNPITPNDLNVANDILRTIIRYVVANMYSMCHCVLLLCMYHVCVYVCMCVCVYSTIICTL